jgi:hypothetical protein
MPQVWPDNLFDLIFFPHMDDRLDELAGLAEPEEWDYHHAETEHQKPILYNYFATRISDLPKKKRS